MPKSDDKKSRKPRSDKFPLTLHKTGRYCKKNAAKFTISVYDFPTDQEIKFMRLSAVEEDVLFSVVVGGDADDFFEDS